MINEIIELSAEEIDVIAGSGQIDPPATFVSTSEGVEIPQIDNNPPG